MRRLIDTLRFQRGLRWQAETPEAADLGFNLTNILLVMLILLAYGFVGSIDYAVEQQSAAERADANREQHQAALLACINGGAPGLYSTDADGNRHYIVCGEPFTVSDENTGDRKKQL